MSETEYLLRTKLPLHTIHEPHLWNGTMFGDLDWPLNASRGLSAIAEFLVRYVVNTRKQV